MMNTLEPLFPNLREALVPAPATPSPDVQALSDLMLSGSLVALTLPPLEELASAVIALAEGRRIRETVALGDTPLEFILSREGALLSVSCFEAAFVPEVYLCNRQVELHRVLTHLKGAAFSMLRSATTDWARQTYEQLCSRFESLVVAPALPQSDPVERRGGAFEAPATHVPLVFGFAVSVRPDDERMWTFAERADVHPLLFNGQLWAFVRGRKIGLTSGPILLAAMRMVRLVREAVDAWEEGRAVNLRARTGRFLFGMRVDEGGETSVTLGTEHGGSLTVPALDLPTVALPVLRLASDLVRALQAADRTQLRNLRVGRLRDEVRDLRRVVQAQDRVACIINQDPERLRAATFAPLPLPDGAPAFEPTRLRYSEKWRIEVGPLNAQTTFLCGDRLIVASAHGAAAIDREGGEVIWSRRDPSVSWLMTGRALLRLTPEGQVEICDINDGRGVAYARAGVRGNSPITNLVAGAGLSPPIAIVSEGYGHLLGIDVRNGEPRWRFTAEGSGHVRIRRAGRIAIVVCGSNCVNAIDLTTGDVVWRFSDRTRFQLQPAVSRETALLLSGEVGRGSAALYGIELYSGRLRFRRALDGIPLTAPQQLGQVTAVAVTAEAQTVLAAFEPQEGLLSWTTADPGLAQGGAPISVDNAMVINAPSGRVSSLDLRTGTPHWTQHLTHPVEDELPPKLEPILRGGALFVPGGSVHVLSPNDGRVLGGALDCDLVPDFLRVDERGWVYVGEESGFLSAFAPGPHLSLVGNP